MRARTSGRARRGQLRRHVTAALTVTVVGLAGLATTAGSASAAPTPAPASEWTQVRGGPAHTGFNPGETTITPGNVTTLKRAFTIADTGDQGITTETLVGNGLVYVLSTQVDDPSTNLRAFNPVTGKKVWSALVGSDSDGTTAALSGQRIFLLTDDPVSAVHAYNARTGAELWKTPVGCGSSIAADGNVVAVSHACDEFASIKFLNATTGAVLGNGCVGDPDTVGFGGPSLRGGVAYLTANATFACTSDGHAHDPWYGRGNTDRHPIFPAVLPDAVYTAGSLVLRDFNPQGFTQWHTGPLASEGKWNLLGMSVDNSRIYLAYRTASGAGALTAFNRSTGARVWSDAISIDAAPAVADGMVFTAEGSHGIAAYSTTTGARLWSLPGRADGAPPVVAGGQLYVGWGPSGTASPAPLSAFRLR